jgi:hypothetical protein
MKRVVGGLLIFAFSVLVLGCAGEERLSKRPERPPGAIGLLPKDDDIPGWKRSGKILRASNDEELYKIFDGGAGLFLQHGFRSLVGQSYKGPKGLELEVYIFDQETYPHAQSLYEDPLAKPSRSKEIADLGNKARIDMSSLFSYGVELVQKGFFVRVVIQDKSEEGLDEAISFARTIANRIGSS